MRPLFLLLAALTLIAAPPPAMAQEGNLNDPDLGESIRKGFAWRDSIWLLGDNGTVVVLDRATGERRVAGTGIADITPDRFHLLALARTPGDAGRLVVRDLRDPSSRPQEVLAPGAPMAIHAANGRLFVVTREAVAATTAQGRWSTVRLDRGVSLGRRAILRSNGRGELFFGMNYGEWGGGLRRIDPATGQVTDISDTPPGTRWGCPGLFDPSCDTVEGLLADPASDDCMIVANGQNHMITRAVILRVCGDQISALYRPEDPVSGDAYAWESMVPTPDGWVAVAATHVFRADGSGEVTQSRPTLRDWSGLRINDEQPDVILVQSACCWTPRVGGGYRMIAVPVVDAR